LIIAKTGAPVVPMRIFGAREALPRGGGRLRFVSITIVIGEPIFFSAAELEAPGKTLYTGLSDRVMTAVSALRLE
jgi:1-acyl-sn-glycerol-3-phosphate acyltransferase